MRKDVLIMLAGAFVSFLPFLGFPNLWDTILLVAAGVSIIALGISVRRGDRPRMNIPSFTNEAPQTTEQDHEA